MHDPEDALVHAFRLAVEGRLDDLRALGRTALRAVEKHRPDLAAQARAVRARLGSASLMRSAEPAALPVDLDSKLELLRRDTNPRPPQPLVWGTEVERALQQTIDEHGRAAELERAGVSATRTMLFVGPPGTGKTVAAHWLAAALGRELLTLDLAAVMSSFLGKTGNNLRAVLAHAAATDAVLLLDEFDAVAKRRDDETEVGELKRLVTVLLQTIDDWPAGHTLVAATNHPELLDPAVWRRFERVVTFGVPTRPELRRYFDEVFAILGQKMADKDVDVMVAATEGRSLADVQRLLHGARRRALVQDRNFRETVLEEVATTSRAPTLDERLDMAKAIAASGHGQREVSRITGLSRDTLRRHKVAVPARRKSARGS